MAEITDDEIAAALLAPKQIDVDGQRIINRDASDLLKAAEYLEKRTRPRKLYSVRTLSPPGTQ